MKMYEYIYNSAGTNLDMQISLAQQLRSKLVDAYDSFVQFCIAAIEFYTTSGFSELQLPSTFVWLVLSACADVLHSKSSETAQSSGWFTTA